MTEGGSVPESSRTRSPRAACCPARLRPQLAIFSAWRVAGPAGAIIGGAAFIIPGLVVIVALAAPFLAASPPTWVLGAGAGAGAAVAAVAVHAGADLIRPSWARAPTRRHWLLYALIGATSAATVGPWLVLVLLGCGLVEVTWRIPKRTEGLGIHAWPLLAATDVSSTGGLLALAWVASRSARSPTAAGS
jgi:chromate transporter